MKSFPRARFGAAVAVAFFCGLVFASGFNLTRFSWAQTRLTSGPTVPAPAVASLAETQTAFETIVDRVKPAVVSIHVEKYAKPVVQRKGRANRQPDLSQYPPEMQEFLRQQFGDGQIPDPNDQDTGGSGSGFIVSKDGYILTNNHVVADMDKVTVTLVDKRSFAAKVIGRDPTTDIAVIKIDGNDFPSVSLGDDATARVGQWVLAVGNPLDLDFTVTAGIISAKGRTVNLPNRQKYGITDFIQTDAAINPGNSGGPLVNIRGEVIGINSAIASQTGYYTGYGFAIPIGLASQVMKDLIKDGTVHRAIVGVSLSEVTPEDAQAAGMKDIHGATVAAFTDDQSPAKKAGVELGDVIVGVDGKPVDQVSTLQRVIRGYTVGQTVQLDIQRFGQHKTIPVKLTEVKPDAPDAVVAANDEESNAPARPVAAPVEKTYEKLGLKVSPVPAGFASTRDLPKDAQGGLLVTALLPHSDTKITGRAEVIEGIVYPTKRDIKSTADLDQVLAGLKSGDVVVLRLYSLGLGPRTQSIRIP